jgi:hypothetical protein
VLDEIEIGPLRNSTAMRAIAVLRVTPSSQNQDLTAAFGNANASHDFVLLADGTDVYVALSTNPGAIDETAASLGGSGVGTGFSSSACWKIPKDTCLPFKVTGGTERATGIATMTSYNQLLFKCATGAATGYLRIYRASLARGQGSEGFPAP